MVDLLERPASGRHTHADALRFSDNKDSFDKILRAEVLLEVISRGGMTPKLRKVLSVLVETGDEYVSMSTLAERAGLRNERAVSNVLGWLDSRDRRLGYFYTTFLERDGTGGYRLQPHVRDVARSVLTRSSV